MQFIKGLSGVAVALFLALLPASIGAAPTDSQPGTAISEPPPPVEVAFGAYVLGVSHVSLQDGSADIDMWIWFRWKAADIRPDLSFELTNGIVSSRSDSDVMDDDGFKLASVRVQARILHQFDVNRFPLDDHVIDVKLEDAVLDSTQLTFVLDEGSALDPNVKVAGWSVALEHIKVAPYTYKTNYGYRSGPAASAYSRINLSISLDRASYGALFKCYWISGLAVGLALMSLLLRASESSARFGMGLGSIFAASANAINISGALPPTTAVTLAEQVNLIAVGVIFACVFASVFSVRLLDLGRTADSARLDKAALLLIGTLYIAMNALVLSVDLNG